VGRAGGWGGGGGGSDMHKMCGAKLGYDLMVGPFALGMPPP